MNNLENKYNNKINNSNKKQKQESSFGIIKIDGRRNMISDTLIAFK